MRIIILLLVLLISSNSFAFMCQSLFSNDLSVKPSSRNIRSTYLKDLKNGNNLDPQFVKRFQLNDYTKAANLAIQNYPYPQGKEMVLKLIENMKKQILHIQNNPHEYSAYQKTTLNMELFNQILASGEKLIKEDKFMSHDVFTFYDHSLRFFQIVPVSAIEKHNSAIKNPREYSLEILNEKQYLTDADNILWTMESWVKNKKKEEYDPLGLHGYGIHKTYSSYGVPPAVFTPMFNYGRPYTSKEFLVAYSRGGFLMSIIPGKISLFDAEAGGSFRFALHDSAHYSRYLHALKDYLRDQYRSKNLKFKDDLEGEKIIEMMIEFVELRNKYYSEMIKYIDKNFSKEYAEEFYDYMHNSIHESNRVLMPKDVLALAAKHPQDLKYRPFKNLVKFTLKFLEENP